MLLSSIPQGVDLTTIPLLPNPSGAPPNFIDPPNNFLVTIIPAATFSLLSLLAVIIRIWFNWSHVRRLEIDDFTCVFAWVIMTAHFLTTATFITTSRHLWDIPVSALDESYQKRLFATQFMIGLALWASKATILLLYVRIFRPSSSLCYVAYATLAISFIIYGLTCPFSIAWCAPSAGQPWDLLVNEACQDHLTVMMPILGALNVVVDCVIVFLPLPILQSLNLSPRKKIGLITIFSVGVLSMIASVIALPFRVRAYLSRDTFDMSQVWACTSAECYTTILVSCVPALSSWWMKVFVKSPLYNSMKSFTSSTLDRLSNKGGRPYISALKNHPFYGNKLQGSDSTKDLSSHASEPSGHIELSVPSAVQISAGKDRYSKHLSKTSPMVISKITTVEQISIPRQQA